MTATPAVAQLLAEHRLPWVADDSDTYRCQADACDFAATSPQSADYAESVHQEDVLARAGLLRPADLFTVGPMTHFCTPGCQDGCPGAFTQYEYDRTPDRPVAADAVPEGATRPTT